MKSRKLIVSMLIVVLAVLAGNASARYMVFYPEAGVDVGNWNDPNTWIVWGDPIAGQWNCHSGPTALDVVEIKNMNKKIVVNTAAEIREINGPGHQSYGGSANSSVDILSGGSLALKTQIWGDYLLVGYLGQGTVNVFAGGSIDVQENLADGAGGEIRMAGHTDGTGNALIHMQGGTLTADNSLVMLADGYSKLQIDAGLVDVGWFDMPGVNSFVDIEAGTIKIHSDRTSLLSTRIASGQITAYGGVGNVIYDYGVTEVNITTVSAEDTGVVIGEGTVWDVNDSFSDYSSSENVWSYCLTSASVAGDFWPMEEMHDPFNSQADVKARYFHSDFPDCVVAINNSGTVKNYLQPGQIGMQPNKAGLGWREALVRWKSPGCGTVRVECTLGVGAPGTDAGHIIRLIKADGSYTDLHVNWNTHSEESFDFFIIVNDNDKLDFIVGNGSSTIEDEMVPFDCKITAQAGFSQICGWPINPDPYDGEELVDENAVLRWHAPDSYTPSGYNIYLDFNELAVQIATPASIGLFHKDINQTDTSSALGSDMNDNTTYYWRVDALDDSNTSLGDMWEFETADYMTGDINRDGVANIFDIVIIANQWLNTGLGWLADMDNSQKVDFKDYALISKWFGSTGPIARVEDTFGDSGSFDEWIIVDEGTIAAPSNWQIISGELAETSNIYGPDSTDNRKGSFIYWKDPDALSWADYKFDVSLWSTDNDGIGAMFRYRDPNNYYKFDMYEQSNFHKLFKMYNGVETTIANIAQGYIQGQKMQLSIEVSGNQINVFLDGVNVFGGPVTDSDIATGTVALYNWGNVSSYFDDFQVQITSADFVLATDDNYQVYLGTTLDVVSPNGVLSNDTALIGSLTAANLIIDARHGDLTLNTDGTFTYTPDSNHVGWDSFVYEAMSDYGTELATVTIRVRSNTEFSVVLIPDTQIYAQSYPAIFTGQTQWIVNNKDNFNIAFVLHEGDLTNDNTVAEWDNVDTSMSILDGNVPYFIAAGNHGMGADGRDTTLLNQYFPVSRFNTLLSFGDVYEPDHIENGYYYFTVGGIDWLVLSLELAPRNKVLDWANQVVNNHPNRRVIVLTHNYMYWDDTRVGPGDYANPKNYGVWCDVSDPNESCNDGEDMWENFVKLHENISFVFSGHIIGDGVSVLDGTGRLVSTGDYGNKVYQMLANYQHLKNGGNGWLRIVTFYPDHDKVTVETYSPYLDQYNTESDEQFEFINVDLTIP